MTKINVQIMTNSDTMDHKVALAAKDSVAKTLVDSAVADSKISLVHSLVVADSNEIQMPQEKVTIYNIR
ncbi:Uncharacterised protein [Mycobacteroides abscessus subsp. abscessus]|nr:Uncharacterised protein [Mycobacteroides abscessus]SIN59078.1 Uncharacterised protein [Mycobacteroides abscessus subsp. abscessus]